MKAKKLFASLLAVLCLAASISNVTYATGSIEESQIESDYSVYSTYLISRSCELTISGTTATCTSTATGNSSVTRIIGDMYLEKYTSSGWEAIDAWRMQCESRYYSNTKTKGSLTKGNYRLKTEFYVTTSSGATETVVAYSSVKYISTSSSG